MKKKKVQKTLLEQLKEVWVNVWKEYKAKWSGLWKEYKTVIGPFIKGTFGYAWQIVAGSLEALGAGIYGCGKVILNKILDILVRM